MTVIFVLTVVGGAGLLGLAVWPGVLEQAVFQLPVCVISLPVLAFWFIIVGVRGVWEVLRTPNPENQRRRWGWASTAVLFGTMALLWFHAPQRVAFALCFEELRELVETAPADTGFDGEMLARQVGPYHIDRYAADRRGGVYFRTHTGPDGVGPDQMSYGFAFRPNGEGTPFGNASYRYRHLFDDWYVFATSDDS